MLYTVADPAVVFGKDGAERPASAVQSVGAPRADVTSPTEALKRLKNDVKNGKTH